MKTARLHGGFSLMELLVVIAIVVILASLAMPAFNSVAFSSNLNRAGMILGDLFALARQEALTKNRAVEFRIFDLPDKETVNTKGWRAVQAWAVQGTNFTPVSRLIVFPRGIVIISNASYSPLLTRGNLEGEADLPSYGKVSYRGVRIRPNGMLEDMSGTDAVLTLKNVHDTGELPANYYTIQINPFTGKASVFRP